MRIGVRVARKRADNCDLFRRENTLAKGILAVALTKWVLFFHSNADEKMRDSLRRKGANLSDFDLSLSL